MATTPATNTPAPGLPGGADPAMVVTGPTSGAAPAVVPKPPAPPAQPAVVSAGPALADVNAKMATVNNLAASQVTAPQPMATLVNPTTGDRKAVPVGSQQAQGLFGSGYMLETKAPVVPPATPTAPPATPTTPAGLTALPEAPVAPDTTVKTQENVDDFTVRNAEITAKSDQAFEQYNQNVQQMRNGTFPLTPDQQAQIDAMTQQFQNLLADQKVANRNYEGAVKLAGIRAGRNMYAPEIELGNVNAAVAAGARALADINAKMASTIATAKMAFQESNFKLLDSVYEKLQEHLENQRKVVSDTYNKTKDALDAAQTKFQNDMATSQFEFQKVQELNKPILEADKQMKDYLYDQMQKYPDSGITAADTVESAVAKIKASKTYQDQQEMIALEKEQTRAQIAASKASAAASYASAEKSRAELAAAKDKSSLTDDQQNKIANSAEAKAIAAGQKLTDKLLAYEDIVKKYGFQAVGTEKAAIDAAYADLKIAYKDAAGLGALTGPDVKILEEAIKPSSGVLSYPGYALSGGQEGVLKSISTVRSNTEKEIKNNQDRLRAQWGEHADDPYVKALTGESTAQAQTFKNATGMTAKDVAEAEAVGWVITKNPDGTYSGVLK